MSSGWQRAQFDFFCVCTLIPLVSMELVNVVREPLKLIITTARMLRGASWLRESMLDYDRRCDLCTRNITVAVYGTSVHMCKFCDWVIGNHTAVVTTNDEMGSWLLNHAQLLGVARGRSTAALIVLMPTIVWEKNVVFDICSWCGCIPADVYKCANDVRIYICGACIQRTNDASMTAVAHLCLCDRVLATLTCLNDTRVIVHDYCVRIVVDAV